MIFSLNFSLKLVNGDEHQLAAESRQILRDWVDDICQAVKNAKVTVYGFGANLNAVEDSFVMLNTCDVDGEFENSELFAMLRTVVLDLGSIKP